MDTQAMLPLPTAMEDTPEDTMARGQLKLSQRLMLRLMLSMDTTPTLLTDHTTTMDTPPMLPLPTEATLPPLMDTPAMLPLPTAMEDTPEDTMARGLLRLSQRLMLKPSMEDMDTLPMPLPPTAIPAMLPQLMDTPAMLPLPMATQAMLPLLDKLHGCRPAQLKAKDAATKYAI